MPIAVGAALVWLLLLSCAPDTAWGAGCGTKGDGCWALDPCCDGFSCHPLIQKCYHSPRRKGEPCSAGYGCGPGLNCEAGSQVCRGPGGVGDSCHATRPCESGLSCQPGVHKCYHSPRREGEPCAAGKGCASGLTCEAGSQVCRRPGGVGHSCHATRPCGSGLSCQPGVHKCYHSPRRPGEPCVAGHPCQAGFYCQSFIHKCVPQTIDYNSSSPCGSLRIQATAEDARRAGLAMSFSTGSAGGVGAFASYEVGLVYGDQGEFGCFATACFGSQTDASIENFASFGIYGDFDGFQGFSVLTGGNVETPFAELGFQTSQVWSASPPKSAGDFARKQLVGTASGISFGVGLLPAGASAAYCFTEVLDDGDPLNSLKGLEAVLRQWSKVGFDPARRPPGLGPPPSADLRGTYRITVQAHGRHLHQDGGGDKLVSTRYQPSDGFTRFRLHPQGDGSYRIQVVADSRWLHVDTSTDRLLSTRYQPDDDFTRFFFEPQADGSYRIRLKATGRYLHEDGNGDKLLSTRYQPNDAFTRFLLQPMR